MVAQDPVKRSAQLSLGFSSAGHMYNHLFEPIFFIAALYLPLVLGLPYEQVLPLIFAGKLLTGLLAPAAGWLGDKWSATGMMAVYFLGFGGAAIGVGTASTPWEIAAWLGVMGAFGSIYHPVGIAWLVTTAVNRGKAMGINGMFGGLGPAVAGVAAGGFIEFAGWRVAFIIPGILVVLTGIAFLVCLSKGWVKETKVDAAPTPPADKKDAVRVYLVLAFALLVSGVIYQATQASLPKLLEIRVPLLAGDNAALGIGLAVGLMYFIGGVLQIWSGWLSDKYPLKWVYTAMIALQAPFLGLAAALSGLPLIAAAVLMVTFNIAAQPPENTLLARYTPAQWRSTAYGMKFVVSFGFSALGVPLAAYIYESTSDFAWLFGALALTIVLLTVIALTLPNDSKQDERGMAAPAPAE